MRPLLLQITVWEVKGALKFKGHETGRPCTIRGPGNELETCVLVFYEKLTRTTTPKNLSVSPLTTKERLLRQNEFLFNFF